MLQMVNKSDSTCRSDEYSPIPRAQKHQGRFADWVCPLNGSECTAEGPAPRPLLVPFLHQQSLAIPVSVKASWQHHGQMVPPKNTSTILNHPYTSSISGRGTISTRDWDWGHMDATLKNLAVRPAYWRWLPCMLWAQPTDFRHLQDDQSHVVSCYSFFLKVFVFGIWYMHIIWFRYTIIKLREYDSICAYRIIYI